MGYFGRFSKGIVRQGREVVGGAREIVDEARDNPTPINIARSALEVGAIGTASALVPGGIPASLWYLSRRARRIGDEIELFSYARMIKDDSIPEWYEEI
jgi:hypothetical protein